jgi:hypothetical protein
VEVKGTKEVAVKVEEKAPPRNGAKAAKETK